MQVANNLQLDRVLPPGPRDYWKQLAAEHKAAAPHLAWMYAQDPWAAKRSVEERQAKAAVRREEIQAAPEVSPEEKKAAREYQGAVEVIMAPAMRELVERCIKDVSINSNSSIASVVDCTFRPPQAIPDSNQQMSRTSHPTRYLQQS